MNGMAMHNLSNGWVDYQNRTCPNTVDFNSAIGGVKKDTEITGHNCGFESLKTLTPDLAYHSAGGEYRCSYLSIESQICNSPSNQSAKTTADQSGQYFAALKYETLSYPNLDIPNCGEITPFAKGDFSHLFNVGNSRHLSRIEYLLVDTTRCIIEFSQPIKKGSTANATSLNCIFLKYQLNQSIHYSVSRCWRKVQLPDCLALRCLRLISAFAAVTRKPAVLSPSSFSISISFITSCGIRTVVICDFAFFAPVAITDTPYVWCISVYAKKTILKALKCISLDASFKSKGEIHLEKQNPDNAENTGGVSNHNVNWSNTMAMYKSTQTHPKFKWRFFSCQQSRYFTVEARSEQEARSMLPDAPCLFSARIRQGVNHG
ncbi:host cell division inhibitor Icd-like protein [Morganella morganii]|uniref:host cell division inhibitor Icd-like protein n=1 Tax=Morganella morganii TaxID=582 RepID=UPI003BC6A6B7